MSFFLQKDVNFSTYMLKYVEINKIFAIFDVEKC
ncbi:hypothetical protein BDE36_2069 [Arcticibacter tournemirensis]|nr:hypothetical protein BDE36_2069 [Arcticibacter tournemirensis]